MAEAKRTQDKNWSELALVVTQGPNKGRRFPLSEGDNIIGRSGGVRLEADGVSRQHARISCGEELEIEDLGSTSGTMLNSRMLVGKDYLFDGDEIAIGPVSLRLTAKRRENRASWIGAFLALGSAVLLLACGLILGEHLNRRWAENAQKQAVETRETLPDWLYWNNLVLPSREEILANDLPATSEGAKTEFNLAMQLYDDRMLDPGNSHQAIIHLKCALAICELLPTEERPPIANRAVQALTELQETLSHTCDSRLFAFIRARKMGYWNGCYEALDAIIHYIPNKNDPYHVWAMDQFNKLNAILKR